jgi:hypothetical protein
MAGAWGKGRWDAIWGILGMLAGATLFAEVYPALKQTGLAWENFGEITLPQVLHVNHWLMIFALMIGGLALLRWFKKR